MCHPKFEENFQEHAEHFDQMVAHLIEQSQRLVSTDVTLLMRDRYETFYRIFNHETKGREGGDHPFALILKHWNEDTYSHGPLRDRMVQYNQAQILKHWGLSITEFLACEHSMCDLLVEIAKGLNQADHNDVNKAMEAIKQATKPVPAAAGPNPQATHPNG